MHVLRLVTEVLSFLICNVSSPLLALFLWLFYSTQKEEFYSLLPGKNHIKLLSIGESAYSS